MPQAMHKPGVTPDAEETARLCALRALDILDTPPEPCFDTITRMAATYMQAETAYLAFVDETRIWVKSTYRGKLREFPRHDSNAERIIHEGKATVLLDLENLPDYPRITGLNRALGLRFFVGVPVRVAGSNVVGVLCVCGCHPRDRVSEEELRFLEQMAALVTDQLELRHLRRGSQAQLPSFDICAEHPSAVVNPREFTAPV